MANFMNPEKHSTSEQIVGLNAAYIYCLSTRNPSTTEVEGEHAGEPLKFLCLDDRERFFAQALHGQNLLCNADFSDISGSECVAWQADVAIPASVGVDFSEKWQLSGGHTAYLYAPAEAPRPSLRYKDAIPIVLNCPLTYRVAGFFGTHRADGRVVVDFFDAGEQKLNSETFTIPHSETLMGGDVISHYHYQEWSCQAPANATHARLTVRLGAHSGSSIADSFLFIAHLFFGVEDEGQSSHAWTPFSQGARELCRYAQNLNWQQYVLAKLPAGHRQQSVELRFNDQTYSFVPESGDVPVYLSSLQTTQQGQKMALLFDPEFYQQTQPNHDGCGHSESLLSHYLNIGWKLNRSPSSYFNVAWYRVNNPQVAEPLQHFIAEGSAALLSPHPLFDAPWYYQTYLKDQQPNAQPLFHYLNQGWRLAYQPHPLFWTHWYEQQYLADNAAQVDPFYHYLNEGWRMGCNPNPLFDSAYYLKTYADKCRIEPDPLSHYIHVGWRENYQPHRLFDPIYYAMQTGFNVHDANQSPLQDFLLSKHAISSHPLFDVAFYREQMGEALPQNALVDYLARGWQAHIDPNPLFSKTYYYQQCQEAKTSQTDALIHYLESGWKNHQAVHPLFDAKYYLEQNPKAHGCIPLQHYLVHGWHNGFSCRAPDDKDHAPHKKLPSNRIALSIPDDRLLPLLATKSNEPRRIGVFAHVFYPELCEEMLRASNHIPGDCTIYISTDSLVKRQFIDKACKKYSKHPVEIRILPNRGRDIATMICGFRDRIQEVEYGVHIHSKQSSHFDSHFADAWRQHLISGNLGSEMLVRNILSVLSDERVGAYAPDHYEPIRSLIQWTGNFSTVKKLLELRGEELSKEHLLDFPSGSMFWFKSEALKPLLALNLRPYHFEAEQGQTDNTLAHAIERSFYYFVEAAGYAWVVGRNVSGSAAEQAVADLQNEPRTAHQLANRFFPTHRELGGLRRHFSQCTRFLARPSLITKPRINLLVPALKANYGNTSDIDTTLTLFNALRECLGSAYDARIITTDVTPDHQFPLPHNYLLAALHDADVSGMDTIADAAQRFRFPFFVRAHDIFVATAWQTAWHTLDLLKQQDQLFSPQQRAFVYLIQDTEFGGVSGSSQFALAEQTFRSPEQTIPVFNGPAVADYFKANGFFSEGLVTYPTINPRFKKALKPLTPKEKIVLIHVNTNDARRGGALLDALVQYMVDAEPDFWSDWRFIVLGGANQNVFKFNASIEYVGQYSEQQYALLASKSALGLALMISHRPCIAATEMAAAGVLVLSNHFGQAKPAISHENLHYFENFELENMAVQVRQLAEHWQLNPNQAGQVVSNADWFYGDSDNFHDMAKALAEQIKRRNDSDFRLCQ
ncbi:MAG: hypothetical protein K9L60_11780 [Methylovulum sp.]|nr:hypothetical protein [Methylovulum sp.]MCF7999720.1 hypothetical protein [Methylovulum sp.]